MFTTFFLACSALTSYSQSITKAKTDTLNVPYTYWCESGGPFIEDCGVRYSIVFTGTVTKICKIPRNNTKPGDSTDIDLYVPQYGVIKINDVKIKNPPKNDRRKYIGKNFSDEKYFKSDCFFNLKLRKGDKVIVFVYSYDGEYSIPRNSILKVKNFNDPIILSVEKYIKNNQDPLSIEADTTIWKKYGQDNFLKKRIECRLLND